MPIRVTVHGTGNAPCSLTGKDSDGLTVSFDDGTIRESFLSWKSFRQLLGMKFGQANAVPPVSQPLPITQVEEE